MKEDIPQYITDIIIFINVNLAVAIIQKLKILLVSILSGATIPNIRAILYSIKRLIARITIKKL